MGTKKNPGHANESRCENPAPQTFQQRSPQNSFTQKFQATNKLKNNQTNQTKQTNQTNQKNKQTKQKKKQTN